MALRRCSSGPDGAVTREFYVNDAGTQIDKLAQSVWARVATGRPGREATIPEGGYHGEYLTELAQRGLEEGRKRLRRPPGGRGGSSLPRDRRTLAAGGAGRTTWRQFGVRFDVVATESSIYERRADRRARSRSLPREGHTFNAEGALWLRTTALGDDKDRVLQQERRHIHLPRARHRLSPRQARARLRPSHRRLGRRTTTATCPRMRAALQALGLPAGFFHVELVQLVRVMRGGAEVTLLEAQRRLRHAARPVRGDRRRRGALLLSHARGDSPVRLRRGPGDEPDRREPGVLRADGARADERHLPRRRADARRPSASAGIDLRLLDAARRARAAQGARGVSRVVGARPPRPTSRTASQVISRDWPGSRTRGITSTGVLGEPGGGGARSCSRARCARCWPTGSRFSGSAPRTGCGREPARGGLDRARLGDRRRSARPPTRLAAPPCSSPWPPAQSCTRCRWSASSGSDYPLRSHLTALEARGVDLAGVERQHGESFRLEAHATPTISTSRETLETRLGVFADFRPQHSARSSATPSYRLPRQHRSGAAAQRARPGEAIRRSSPATR